MQKHLVDALTAASNAPGTALAHAALVIASIEYPRIVPEPYLAQLAADRDLPELSMGTTQDFAVAVEEGATIVRVGTKLYR